MIKIKLLGTSAGGGLPQWNCNCQNCDHARHNVIPSRTQSSIAITEDNKKWVLINASPDIRYQINNNPDISYNHSGKIRDNRFDSIILLDGQLDHTLGLLSMREGNPLNVYCTNAVNRQLTSELGITKVMNSYCGINYNEINPNVMFSISSLGNMEFIPVNIESNSPKYSDDRDKIVYGTNIGLIILNRITGCSLFYAPGLKEITPVISRVLESVTHVLIDGTCWDNDELVKLGISNSSARDMGHIPQSESVYVLSKYKSLKKILIHINNTNPILNPGSPQYKELGLHDIELSTDNQDIYL